MDKQERHEMILEGTSVAGVDEWACPICGRRMLITWEPEFKRTLLKDGDNTAIHSAGKSNLSLGLPSEDLTDAPTSAEELKRSDDDPRLAPWLSWLEKTNFERLWGDDA